MIATDPQPPANEQPTPGGLVLEAPRVLPTLNDDGSRRWIRPKPSKGRFLTARRAVAWSLIAIFALIPYLHLNGKPLVLLDLTTRRFTILGKTFLPTDTLLLALLMVGVFLTIFFLTALFGRVWCGWACPQTVYMEFVFRPLERLLEGTPGRAAKNSLIRSGFGKVLKPIASLIVCAYLAHTFLAYFVGVDKLKVWVTQSPFEHPAPFLVMAVVTALMMFDFMFFREQTCLVACPYGRLQSALIDRQSLIIGYDRARGEPRGKAAKAKRAAEKASTLAEAQAERNIPLPIINSYQTRTGDCVDCNLCVTTCPTGIDIRNGLQMECIGCAQCIDACDAVMEKLNRPRGLIRYSTQASLAGEPARRFRPRMFVYPTLLLIVTVGFLLVLFGQSSANITVLRGLGRPYAELPDGSVENNVRIKVINRTDEERLYQISASDLRGLSRLTAEENPMRVGPGESKTQAAIIVAPVGSFTNGAFDTTVKVEDGHGLSVTNPYRLQGPFRPSNAAHHDDDHDKHEEHKP